MECVNAPAECMNGMRSPPEKSWDDGLAWMVEWIGWSDGLAWMVEWIAG